MASSQQSTGFIGALAKRIFGPTPLEDSDDGDLPESPSDKAEEEAIGDGSRAQFGKDRQDDSDEVDSLDGGISGKEKLQGGSSNPASELTFQANPSLPAGEAATPAPERVSSHPIELSPSGTAYSSFAGSPDGSLKASPQNVQREGLTPRLLQDALDASKSGAAADPGVRQKESEPIDLPKVVPAIRTKPENPPPLMASPTTDIVDDLLGEVVHGRLTKDSLPRNAIARREIDLRQEAQSVMPGEQPGELKLLQPGKEPKVVAAVAKTPQPPPQSSLQSAGPVEQSAFKTAHAGEAEAGADAVKAWAEAKQDAGSPEPSKQLQRTQESAQLVIGHKPGEFEVLTPDGKGIIVEPEGVRGEYTASPTDSTRTLNSALDAIPPSKPSEEEDGVVSSRVPHGLAAGKAQAADLEAVDDGTPTSRKRLRDPEGPFRVAGPPTSAPKTSDAASSPGFTPPLQIDAALPQGHEAGRSPAPGSSPGEQSSLHAANIPSAAEQAVLTGAPIGSPSGKSQGLTPSPAQIAEAKSLAGGKVDPITGHSTLDARELGLPANSGELIFAAVHSGGPEPVGGFSSSVAVKPTTGHSTDLSDIMESNQKEGDIAVTTAPAPTFVQPATADSKAASGSDVGFLQQPAEGQRKAEVLSDSEASDAISAATARLGLLGNPQEGAKEDDDRVDLASVKRESVQTAAAPVIPPLNLQAIQERAQDTRAPSTSHQPSQAKSPTIAHGDLIGEAAQDDREPLEAVKRETTQAAAAPAIAEAHVNDPEFGGSEATGTTTLPDPETTTVVAGSTAAGVAVGGVALLAAGPVAGLAAAGLAGGAALRYLSGADQDTAAQDEAGKGSQDAVGVTGSSAQPEIPHTGQAPTSTSAASEQDVPNVHGTLGTALGRGQSGPTASKQLQTELPLPAAKAAPLGSAVEAPGRTSTGAASLSGSSESGSGRGNAAENTRLKPVGGAAITTRGPTLRTPPESPGPGTQTPRTYPSMVESPVSSNATPRGRGAAEVEHRHIDSAAENAKRAAAAVGLGSLFGPIDQASSSFKREHSDSSFKRDLQPAAPPQAETFLSVPPQVEWKPSAGSEALLSDEAAPLEQEKALKAADFDSKIQSGLEEIEPEPEAAIIKTADPPAPTAAKARAVDTPFSNNLPSSEGRDAAEHVPSAPGVPPAQQIRVLPPRSGGAGVAQHSHRRSQESKGSEALVSTGSDEFDAFIDREARAQREKPGSAPRSSRPSSNLPDSYKSEDMLALDPDESAVGDTCGDCGLPSCESPSSCGKTWVSSGTKEGEKGPSSQEASKAEASAVPTAELSLPQQPESKQIAEDEKMESPKAVVSAALATPLTTHPDSRAVENATQALPAGPAPRANPAFEAFEESDKAETLRAPGIAETSPAPGIAEAEPAAVSGGASIVPNAAGANIVEKDPEVFTPTKPQTAAVHITSPQGQTETQPGGGATSGLAPGTKQEKKSRWMCCFAG